MKRGSSGRASVAPLLKENPANSSDVAGKFGGIEKKSKNITRFDPWFCRYFGFRTQPSVNSLELFVDWSFVKVKGHSDPQKLKAARLAAFSFGA